LASPSPWPSPPRGEGNLPGTHISLSPWGERAGERG